MTQGKNYITAMVTGSKKHLHLLLIYLIATLHALAQPGEIIFTRTTKENGLSATKINYFIKDSRGYYWLSSVNGLQRFDGNRMVHFRHDASDSNSLPDNDVGYLMEDHQKRLWLNAGGQPCIYDPIKRNFKKIPVDVNSNKPLIIYSFFQDSKKQIWMMAPEAGFFILDTAKNIFRTYTSAWPPFFSKAYYMAEDNETGRYWLTTDKGLVMYDSKTKTYHHANNNPEGLQCFSNPEMPVSHHIIYLDKNKILWAHHWVDTKGFVSFRYDTRKNRLLYVDNKDTQLWGFLTDRYGNTWGYGSILGRYDNSLNRFIEVPQKRNTLNSIDFNGALYMYEDPEDNLWLLTDHGLYNFNLQHQYFETVNTLYSEFAKSNMDGNTNGFIETNDGHIISLSWGNDGLYFFDSNFSRMPPQYGFKVEDTYKKDRFFMLTWCGLQDSRGMIWVGCQGGHIMVLNPVTKKIQTFIPPEFENRTIRCIKEDAEGNIWFGAHSGVIVKWEHASEKFIQITSEKNMSKSPGWIQCIVQGKHQDIWAGATSGGILHIDMATGKVIEQIFHNEKDLASLGNSTVFSVIQLNQDTLAIGTGRGIDLFNLNTQKFSHITENDGMPGGSILSLATDRSGNLWFTSEEGIGKIHLPDKRVHEYGQADGITERDFQVGAVQILKNGRIVFGNSRGFVYFNPAVINEPAAPSDVTISGFRIFDKSLSVDSLLLLDNKIRLEHFQNSITIQFASLGNMIHNRPLYYYMLEGVDKNWVQAGNTNEAIYTYLPSGNYHFKVKCISPDGVESKNITSFDIYVEPPFYLRWWFLLLIAALIGTVSYYIYLLRSRRRNEREIIRNRIARDLHDDMGSVLSTINILSTMIKTKMTDDPVKASEYVGKIGDNSQRMMEAMDDIVWAIKPDNDNMQKITARMREFATSILESKDIEIGFNIDDRVNDIKLNMEARRDFFLIFKEAVNNAAKYSHCSKCSIHISPRQHRLVLEVHDNGVGFDVTNADSGNGLSNMQKRAAALKGKLLIQSELGAGTKVTLDIPL